MSKSNPPNRKNPALNLAARIRSAVSRRTDDAHQREALLARRAQRIATELPLLFDQLEEMGHAAAVLQVDRGKEWIRLAIDQREIRVTSTPRDDRPDQLEILATGVEQALSGYFSDEAGTWALRIQYGADKARGLPERSRTLSLLGAGLEWLVVQGLDLPLGEAAPEEDTEPTEQLP